MAFEEASGNGIGGGFSFSGSITLIFGSRFLISERPSPAGFSFSGKKNFSIGTAVGGGRLDFSFSGRII